MDSPIFYVGISTYSTSRPQKALSQHPNHGAIRRPTARRSPHPPNPRRHLDGYTPGDAPARQSGPIRPTSGEAATSPSTAVMHNTCTTAVDGDRATGAPLPAQPATAASSRHIWRWTEPPGGGIAASTAVVDSSQSDGDLDFPLSVPAPIGVARDAPQPPPWPNQRHLTPGGPHSDKIGALDRHWSSLYSP